MGKRLGVLMAFFLAVGLSVAGVALAHPDHAGCDTNAVSDREGVIDSAVEAQTAKSPCGQQHGGNEGHLPPRQSNVKLVGKAPIDTPLQGRVADVGVFKNHAYLAAFREPDCKRGGVYVFDIKNPARPAQVGFIEAAEGTYVGEGVQTINVDTPKYEGDVLIHNNEICGSPETGLPNGGISLVDVSNPKAPEKLAEGVGDFDPEGSNGPDVAHTVHSAFAWQDEDEDAAYAVLVDNEEGADVDIMDISDPRNPEIVAEYDLDEQFPQITQEDLGTASSFFHDVVVKKIKGRQTMLLSYWDGGYVKLDVTDPTKATYIADSDFKNPDPEALESGFTVEPEGNAHQAEFSLKNDSIIAADEDFSPYSVEARNVTQNNEEFDATQGSDTPQIDSDTSINGQTVFVGRACNGDPAVPAGDGTQVAVVERGVCAFTDKVANVEGAGGYVGVIVMNSERPDGCSDLLNMSVQGNIPALFVGRDTGFEFFGAPYDEDACRAGNSQAPIGIGTTGDTVKVEAVFDGWGYAHFFANGSGKLQELDTYAIPEAHDPRFAEGFGDLSVHEVAMSQKRNDLAYFSYYSGGFRVAKIAGGKLVETGSFIDEGGNNFWGVQTFKHKGKEYVAASDRDFGLYIFEYTGN
ncbi:MAG: PA domain-containing protein [Rubrobacter sp.]